MKKPSFITALETEARRARHSLFVRLMQHLDRPLVILDIGGVFEYWQNVGYSELGKVQIVLLNILPEKKNLAAQFSSVIGDARDLSRYANGAFDVVFSNSVLGHVGSYLDQQSMAREIVRVGKRYFVQTPNHGFPVDWRTRMPFFHFLPASFQAWCFQHACVGVYPRVRDPEEAFQLATRVRNIRQNELAQLFPGAKVVPERFFGFTKSFMIYSGFDNTKTGLFKKPMDLKR